MRNSLGCLDTSTAHTTLNSSHSPQESITVPIEHTMLRETPFGTADSRLACPNDFAVQLQTASRTYLSKRDVRPSAPGGLLPRVSSASSLARETRYAQAERALRIALSRCETEPSPLKLQVRALEKGLRAWNARAGRGYERVQKAEEALAAARRDEEESVVRSSLRELQREKWLAMKERDEALAMVEKMKDLIKELNTEITRGPKESPKHSNMHSAPQKASESVEEKALSCETASKKAAILFSGKLPIPYLENLPRSRRSVEPLRLPLQIMTNRGHRRSSTLHSEPASSSTPSSSSTTRPPTPHPTTPTDDFGAAFIHTPPPLKSVAQYLAEMEETREAERVHGQISLPSYVGPLLDELGEDRVGNENFHILEVSRPPTHRSSTTSNSTMPPILDHKLLSKGSKRLLGHRFSGFPRVPSLPLSPSQYFRSKENHELSLPLHNPPIDSPASSEKRILLDTATGSSLPSSSPSPASDISFRKHQIKSPGRMGNLMESVKRGVKRVSRRGE